jgi:periplasmic divalent cation tolerance protein
MHDVRLVFCTFPDAATARQIGTSLVEKQLAACVNLLPGVESVYRWQGQVENAAEVLGVFKTTTAALADFETALCALHPYEVPEMVALEPAAVAAPYLQWLRESVAAPDAG